MKEDLTGEPIRLRQMPEKKGVIARRDFAPRTGGGTRPPWLSRDWDLEGKINCDCKECIANNGRGKCGSPALVKISKKGKCSGYVTIPKEKTSGAYTY
jgi:hypothetical protein